jgi:hypothetical protein
MAQLDRSLDPGAYPAFTRTVCPVFPAPLRFAAMFAPFPEAGATYAYLPPLVPQKMTQSAYLREGREGAEERGRRGGELVCASV